MTNDPVLPKQVTLAALAQGFSKIALVSFGGGLSAWAQRVIVEERQWLGDEEFLSALTLCRILPGPNQLNMAVYVGSKLRGISGALAALAGLFTLPVIIILGLGYAYFEYHDIPAVKSLLRGMTAASVGLVLSMGFKVGARYKTQPVAIAFAAVAFVATGPLHFSLVPTLAVLAPLAVWWYWPKEPAQS